MPSISTYTLTTDDFTYTANQVKDLIARGLNLPILDNYVIVVQKPSLLGRFKKWLSLTPEEAKKDEVQFLLLKGSEDFEKEK